MVIEFLGQAYHIVLSEKTAGIRVIGYENGTVQLLAHYLIPQAELLQYLKARQSYIQKEVKKRAVDRTIFSEIVIFDKKYGIKADPRTKAPYLRDFIIYTSALPTHEKDSEQLKTMILQAKIMEQIALWEERLDFLLDHISLKQLKSSTYILNRTKRQITYSKKLTNMPLDRLTYSIAISVFDYLTLDEEQRDGLLTQYTPNWKHLKRISEYETQY